MHLILCHLILLPKSSHLFVILSILSKCYFNFLFLPFSILLISQFDYFFLIFKKKFANKMFEEINLELLIDINL